MKNLILKLTLLLSLFTLQTFAKHMSECGSGACFSPKAPKGLFKTHDTKEYIYKESSRGKFTVRQRIYKNTGRTKRIPASKKRED